MYELGESQGGSTSGSEDGFHPTTGDKRPPGYSEIQAPAHGVDETLAQSEFPEEGELEEGEVVEEGEVLEAAEEVEYYQEPFQVVEEGLEQLKRSKSTWSFKNSEKPIQ